MEKLEKAAAHSPSVFPKSAPRSHAAGMAVQTKLAREIQDSPRMTAQRKLNELANGSPKATTQRQFNAAIQKVSAKTEHRRRAVQSAELAEEEEGTAQARKAGGAMIAEPNIDSATP